MDTCEITHSKKLTLDTNSVKYEDVNDYESQSSDSQEEDKQQVSEEKILDILNIANGFLKDSNKKNRRNSINLKKIQLGNKNYGDEKDTKEDIKQVKRVSKSQAIENDSNLNLFIKQKIELASLNFNKDGVSKIANSPYMSAIKTKDSNNKNKKNTNRNKHNVINQKNNSHIEIEEENSEMNNSY